MTQEEMADGFVTIMEAARFLKLGRATVYAMVRDGNLKSQRFGRSVRIPKAALTAIYEQAMSCAGPQT